MSHVIAPGGTIGVLGGGQLGRMFAIAARRLGYRVHTLAPEDDTPTGQIADVEINAPYDDLDAVRAFASGVDVVTFEFENVPAAATAAAEEFAIVRPSGHALFVAQHRIREKSFLADRGLPVTPFATVRSEDDLRAAVAQVGCPAVLKTASFGYDGKGQVPVARAADAMTAWEVLGRQEAILESFIDLEREISVVAARGVDGTRAHFAPIENAHRHHILDVSVAPANVPPEVARDAAAVAQSILEALDYVGVLCVEFFLARDGRLLINELAPRPHNSGHLTFDACRTSQFEQQLRAICGLPLGSPELLQPAAMANLLGDLWNGGELNWPAALAIGEVKLHLYGKATPRPGRKMGHLTAMASSAEQAKALVLRAREQLSSLKSQV
jgi:5-(carboxyamino)imidazole ribonucleotide synthase